MVLAVVCTTMILFVEGFLVSLLWPGLPLAITITLARVLNLEARVASFKMNKLRFKFFGAEWFELWKKSLDRLTGPLFPIGIEHLIYMKFFCYGSSYGYKGHINIGSSAPDWPGTVQKHSDTSTILKR